MLADLLGLSLEEVQESRAKEQEDDKVREAQAILLFLEKPEAFISKNCDWCHGLFLTSYQYVTVCSTHCRAASLARVGITWNPMHLPWERWERAQIPTEYSIPPKALEVLLQLAEDQALTEAVNNADPNEFPELVSAPLEPTSNSSQSNSEPPKPRDVELLPLTEIEVEDFFL